MLRGRRELADLANNNAVVLAEKWAQSLSSLMPSLEFPPYDAGLSSEEYHSTRGAAAAMPVAQVGVEELCSLDQPAGCVTGQGQRVVV